MSDDSVDQFSTNPENSAEQADLTGMSRSDAYEYVASYIASLNRLRKDIKEADEQLHLWKQRAKLAYDRQDRELAKKALQRWESAQADINRLKAEEQPLERTVDLMKANFERLKRTPQQTVDAEALAQQMQEVVGDTKTEQAVRSLNVESELEQLKQKMELDKEFGDE